MNRIKTQLKDWNAMSMIHALKEWDAQIQALETGQTALVIRKGGIVQFEIEHREFWLYPTFLHQNPGELRPKFSSLLRLDPIPDLVPGRVSIRAFARVERLWKLKKLDKSRNDQIARAALMFESGCADARDFTATPEPQHERIELRDSTLKPRITFR